MGVNGKCLIPSILQWLCLKHTLTHSQYFFSMQWAQQNSAGGGVYNFSSAAQMGSCSSCSLLISLSVPPWLCLFSHVLSDRGKLSHICISVTWGLIQYHTNVCFSPAVIVCNSCIFLQKKKEAWYYLLCRAKKINKNFPSNFSKKFVYICICFNALFKTTKSVRCQKFIDTTKCVFWTPCVWRWSSWVGGLMERL